MTKYKKLISFDSEALDILKNEVTTDRGDSDYVTTAVKFYSFHKDKEFKEEIKTPQKIIVDVNG